MSLFSERSVLDLIPHASISPSFLANCLHHDEQKFDPGYAFYLS